MTFEPDPPENNFAADPNPVSDGNGRKPSPEVSIPDHKLLQRIGHGSYGEVWLARSSLGMFRAVKIVHRKTFTDKRPFERELSGIQKFEPISRSHEGFIDVLHAGKNEEAGYFFYVMELGDDVKLGQNIDPANYSPRTLGRGAAAPAKMDSQRCLQLGLALSNALAHLHKHALVHRDIKPSNIIFINGVPKLADIGLVADINEARSYVGTEGFIPPEGPGTPQADIYALGKVLYEACTGRDRQDFPELPTNWDKSPEQDLFLELNEVILQACKTEPAKRYQSAQEMHADLVLLSNGKSVKRLRALERQLAKFKRIAVAVAAVVIVGAGIGYHFYREWRMALDARQRQVGGHVVNETRAVESADLLGAARYFAEALALDQGSRERENLHRVRIGSAFEWSPRLESLVFASGSSAALSLSPDGSHALVAGGPAQSIDLITGEVSVAGFGHNQLNDVAFSPDGTLVVTAGANLVCVWRTRDRTLVWSREYQRGVNSAQFSTDGAHVVTGGDEGIACVRNAHTGELEHNIHAHNESIRFAAFSPGADLIVTCSHDHTAAIWDVVTGKMIGERLLHGGKWVNRACFSPDGKFLVTAGEDHKARIFDVKTGRRIPPDLLHEAPVKSAVFSADQKYILTGALDYTAKIWRTEDHQLIEPNGVLRHSGRVMDACFAAASDRIVTACDDGTIRAWNLAGTMVLPKPANYSLNGARLLERSGDAFNIVDTSSGTIISRWTNAQSSSKRFDLNRDGTFVAAIYQSQPAGTSVEYQVSVLNTSTGQPVGPAVAISNSITGSWLSDDGQRLLIIAERSCQLWDTARATSVSTAFSYTNTILSCVQSSDGRLLAVWSDHLLRVIEASTAREIFSALKFNFSIGNAQFSPDNALLLTSTYTGGFDQSPAQLWNMSTGTPLPLQFIHDDGIYWASFSPDGRRIVTASEDHTAKIWDAMTGKTLTQPLKHSDQVTCAVFSPDGRWILTTSVDKTARVWNVETGEPLTPALRHLFPVITGRFCADGRNIITVDNRKAQRLWKLPLDERPVSELVTLAQLMSSGRIIVSGGDPSPQLSWFKDVWKRVRAAYPGDFATSREKTAAWHDVQAQDSELQKEWFAVAFHLEHLNALRPGDPEVLRRLETARRNLNNSAPTTK